MTKEIYRDDSYLQSCESLVLGVHDGGIELDRTVFYYESGGQPGDQGTLFNTSGSLIDIVDTQKEQTTGLHLHVPKNSEVVINAGDIITASIDWDRRYRLMRMHSALHVFCAVVDAQVTGAKVDVEKSRIDFNPDGGSLDKTTIQLAVDELIAEDRSLTSRWVSMEELAARPEVLRAMSVPPPTGVDAIRLIEIEGADLQPCGGTHVASTSEIGQLVIGKIENKGRHNRRINIRLED